MARVKKAGGAPVRGGETGPDGRRFPAIKPAKRPPAKGPPAKRPRRGAPGDIPPLPTSMPEPSTTPSPTPITPSPTPSQSPKPIPSGKTFI